MRLKFKVNDQEVELYFGMVSVKVFAEYSAKEYERLNGGTEIDGLKALAIMIHSGRCNACEINFDPYPDFIDSYEAAESLANDIETVNKINDAWISSRPVKEMLDRLENFNLSEKKNKVKRTGMKSKPTPTVS